MANNSTRSGEMNGKGQAGSKFFDVIILAVVCEFLMAVSNKDRLNRRCWWEKVFEHRLQINYAGHRKCHFEYEI